MEASIEELARPESVQEVVGLQFDESPGELLRFAEVALTYSGPGCLLEMRLFVSPETRLFHPEQRPHSLEQ